VKRHGVDDDTIVKTPLPLQGNRSDRHVCYKIKGTFLANLDMQDYPFDTQRLPIVIRHLNAHSNELMIIPDLHRITSWKRLNLLNYRFAYPLPRHRSDSDPAKSNLRYTPTGDSDGRRTESNSQEIFPHEWRMVPHGRQDWSATYLPNTSFGAIDFNPLGGGSWFDKPSFSCMITTFALQRWEKPFAMRLFIPLGVLLLVGVIAVWIPLDRFQERLTLAVTALLAIVVWHLTQSSQLPYTAETTLVDRVFVQSYIYMLILLVVIVLMHVLYVAAKKNADRQKDPEGYSVQPVGPLFRDAKNAVLGFFGPLFGRGSRHSPHQSPQSEGKTDSWLIVKRFHFVIVVLVVIAAISWALLKHWTVVSRVWESFG
jgi:hypothetical protein